MMTEELLAAIALLVQSRYFTARDCNQRHYTKNNNCQPRNKLITAPFTGEYISNVTL
jgi:hypothetical protein